MDPFDSILGHSEGARAMRAFGRRAAGVDAPVLLTGETGTGKGLLARAIHAASARARAPFVAVNCAGVPESLFESEFFGHTRGAFTGAQYAHKGLLEQANGGTLFLDEIGELATTLQAKLLTALEDGEFRRLGGERALRFDARLLAATGIDIDGAVARGTFRRDLYHRLLVLAFHLPPLRNRPEDIHPLARHFLLRYARRYHRPVHDLDTDARDRLLRYPWPGNVRELAHSLEAAVLACDDAPRIAPRHLPAPVRDGAPPHGVPVRDPGPPTTAPPPGAAAANGTPPHPTPRRYSFYGPPAEERRRIQEALRRHHGNKTRAAAELGMARNTLRNKIREYDIGTAEPGRVPEA